MSISNLYSEYADLEAQISALEMKKEQLRPHIVKMMIEQGLDKVETALGKFSIGKRKVWSYPEEVDELNEAYKAAKAKAEKTGDATFEEVDQLRYTPVKL